MEIEVIRSRRRTKTACARLVGNTMRVTVPSNMPEERVQEIVENFQRRFARRELTKKLDSESLRVVAQGLNQKYFDGTIEIREIQYAPEQTRIFGSCNTRAKTIRISHRVAGMPDWVRNYVIVHEMAHIVEPAHDERFWKLVSRYEMAERARGYLMAKGLDENGEPII